MGENPKSQPPLLAYKEMSTKELNVIAERNKDMIDTTYQLDYNYASVFIFKNKTALLFPGSGGNGIMFNDTEVMKKMIEEKKFPVKGDGSFWENEKERVLNLDSSIGYYCSRLSELLGYNVRLDSDPRYLKELSKAINQKLASKKVDINIYRYAAIYIGELIRMKKKGQWKLHPVYTLNVYYIPEIVCGNTFCDPWSYVINQMETASVMPIDIESLAEKASDFAPFTNRDYVSI